MTSFKLFGCFSRNYKTNAIEPVPEVQDVFARYAENGTLDAVRLQQFLREVQGESQVTLEYAQNLLEQQQHQQSTGTVGTILNLSKSNRPGLSLDSFFQFLLNASLNAPLNSAIHHDMTDPLAHYYIYTGHNSYLTGNQLSSDCSTVPLCNALRKGVRVIELDLWPNSSKDKIQVLHGKTLTAPVDFEKCIAVIKENAFVASEYPVVVTLEDHLPAPLQAKAAEVLRRVLGSDLFYPDTDMGLKEFPSPESLKRRIVVSTKPPKEYLEATAGNFPPIKELEEQDKVEETVEEPVKDESWGEEVPEFQSALDDQGLSLPRASSAAEHEQGGVGDCNDTIEEAQPNHSFDPSYARLITIRAGKPKGNSLKETLTVEDLVKRVSFSEPQLQKVAKAHPESLVLFTQRNIVRVYPYGLRFDSSNYNPLVSWTHGAQMVAFNMQGYGRPLWLVQGFFRANGGCGYVKKPHFLLESGDGNNIFNPREVQPTKLTLKVKVLMGLGWLEKFGKHHFDRYSPPDFYTRVGIAGVPADTVMKKTKTMEDEWIPRWESEFEFPLTVPELALLRIEVHEYDKTDKDDFGGQTCIPVAELKTGYRCVQLHDKKGNELAGVRLLFRFQLSKH